MFTLDIEDYKLRLDRSCIFIPEELDPDSAYSISGRFRFCLPRASLIKGIRVRLIGLFKIPRDGYQIPKDREIITFIQDQSLASSQTLNSFEMVAGNYEFQFKIPLTSKMIATVTGPEHCYHSYKVQAIIGHRFKRDFIVSQPVRIYNRPTLHIDYLWPYFSKNIECQTDQNIQYCISMPDVNIPFGCSFPTECWFAPISKDLRLKTVTISVTEEQHIRLDATAAQSNLYNVMTLNSIRCYTVFSERYDISPETSSSGHDCTAMEWRLNKLVRLPRSLDSCSQTISTKPIKITHALVITAEFQGSNGQILAKVNENIPFRVYMTPDTIGEDAVVYGQDIQSLQERGSPPPPYGNHKRCFHNRSDFPEPSTPAGFHSPIPEAGEKSVGSGIQGSILPSPGASDRQNQNTLSPLEAEQQQVALQNALDTSTARERSPVKEPEAHRFVCDSNPVAAFLDDRQSRLRKGQDRRGDVGTWVHDDRVTSESDGQQNQFPIHALLPPKQNQMKLVDIYFRRIHPVLPLVDEDATLSQFTSGTLSIPLIQSICLVASKDRNAAPLLYLGSGRALLPLEKFSHLIYKNILENIPRREERQRITTIQILALLSLHEWGPYGSEDSSSCLARAIHHAQTIGLHLRKPDREPGSSLDALFWCLWCLDRWNAAIHGRPVIIHGRDIGQEVADVVPSFKPPFRISLLLARQLSQVIDCYRPIVDKSFNQDIELSTFEEIIENSNSWGTNPELLDSLELFHHAIVILWAHSKDFQGRSRSRVSNICQSQSILTIASLCRRKRIEDLLPIHISAYSLSLAFSITYKQMKDARLPSIQFVARENLALFHKGLRSLSDTWWMAAVMTHLGRHALENTRIQESQEHLDQPGGSTAQSGAVVGSEPPIADLLNSSNAYYTPQQDSSALENPCNSEGNINYPDENFQGTGFSSELDYLLGRYDLASAEEGYFDNFFENFLDVNLPSSLGEQFLGDPHALV